MLNTNQLPYLRAEVHTRCGLKGAYLSVSFLLCDIDSANSITSLTYSYSNVRIADLHWLAGAAATNWL